MIVNMFKIVLHPVKPIGIKKSDEFRIIISYLGMKSLDLLVCDRASTITHVDRVKKSNPWYNKIWLRWNVTIWS